MGMFDCSVATRPRVGRAFTTSVPLGDVCQYRESLVLPTESMVQSVSDAVLNSGLYPNGQCRFARWLA